jgi:phospholipid/cholesterol/gamma-HCH transport system permease protein
MPPADGKHAGRDATAMTGHFSLSESQGRNGLILALAGELDEAAATALWPRLMGPGAPGPVEIDLAGVMRCDGAGAALIQAVQAAHPGVALTGASPALARVLSRFAEAYKAAPHRTGETLPLPARVGRIVIQGLAAMREGIGFIGTVVMAIVAVLLRRGRLRFSECAVQAEAVGTRALPLITLLGFLIGLILAFQSALPMRRFGAEVFVADLVSIALMRELAPLMAAVILAGRSGSAFAAEIGTMKVNQEIDALYVMGFDPVQFLVLPRIVGAMLAMPVLAVVMLIAGIAGMATVMMGFGFPLSAILRQVTRATTPEDLFGGLFKAMVFGLTVALIGCRRGMETGTGPKAVGESATATVVGSIMAIVLLDGGFAVLFNLLGL